MLSINIQTPSSIMETIRNNFKRARLDLELTQEGLSNRSGVSLGSIKRFENSGEISLKSILKLAIVLNCLDDFSKIALPSTKQVSSIDELLKQDIDDKQPKRGKIK